jgi:hypothetical protein
MPDVKELPPRMETRDDLPPENSARENWSSLVI